MNLIFNDISILIQDNFLSNCDEIRNFALKQEYECKNSGNNWRGCRTSELISSGNKLVYDMSLKIYNTVVDYYNLQNLTIGIKTFFHYSTEETKLYCLPTFDQFKLHKDVDDVILAGVIYLHPHPKNNCGTILVHESKENNKYIENVYNRLICYPGNILHGPNDLFGDSIETGRLTVTFFLNRT
jgi:hypothetical protein